MDLSKVNKGLEYYEVGIIDGGDRTPVIGEDGQYHTRGGYAVRNKATGFVEHTTTLLPGAIFQAQHLDSTLDGLLNPPATEPPALVDFPTEDTVPN